MSANNWRICPKCKREAAAKSLEASRAARKSYGEVSPEEYLKLLAESKSEARLTETLREDWEIRTDDKGVFEVWYACSCETCGFKFDFQHKQQATS